MEISTVQARINEFVMWVMREWRLNGDIKAAEIEYRLTTLGLMHDVLDDVVGLTPRVPQEVMAFLTGNIKEEDDGILPPSG